MNRYIVRGLRLVLFVVPFLEGWLWNLQRVLLVHESSITTSRHFGAIVDAEEASRHVADERDSIRLVTQSMQTSPVSEITVKNKRDRISSRNSGTSKITTKKRDPPSGSQPPPTRIPSSSTITGEKYLLYFAHDGFSNQQLCLHFASIFARELNRTLLLPPVLPWKNEAGSTVYTHVRDKDGNIKSTHDDWTEPEIFYLEHLPAHRYLPMDHVMDVEFTLPHLRTMDVQDFFQRYYYPKT